MTGRVIENPGDYEAWKSTIPGTIVVKRLDRRGDLAEETLQEGQVLHITPNERRLNMEMAADDDLNVFKNGFLTPVRLIETAEDIEDLKDNPNHMTEEDMRAVFKIKAIAEFRERMGAVTNPITITRMIELAGSDEVNATVRQVDFLKSQLEGSSVSVNEVQVVGSPPRPSPFI